MPQAKTLTIKDGASTPVDHVFNPVGQTGGTMKFKSNSGTVLASREELTVSLREGQGNVAPKVSLKLTLPVEQVVDGQPTVTRQYLGGVDFVIAPGGTAEERKARRVLLANALLNADIAATIDNVESFF